MNLCGSGASQKNLKLFLYGCREGKNNEIVTDMYTITHDLLITCTLIDERAHI